MNFDSVHNFYEPLVFQYIVEHVAKNHPDAEYLADVACMALNHLPPRYIRHDVDMAFFLTSQERAEIDRMIADAISKALEQIGKKP